MFIRVRFCWTSLNKNELMSHLARVGACFFPRKQHNMARGKEREEWEGGEGEEGESCLLYIERIKIYKGMVCFVGRSLSART